MLVSFLLPPLASLSRSLSVLLDETLKPWLLEINASPSLSITTKPDRVLKTKLIHDLLEVVVPPDFPDTKTSKGSTSWNTALAVGNFELLYSEELVQAEKEGGGNATGSSSAGGGGAGTTKLGGGSGGASSIGGQNASSSGSGVGTAGPVGKWR